METHTYKTIGINLGSHHLGDYDKILNIFSRELGKIRVVAKSARKLKNKFTGHLEIFGYYKYFISRGRNLDILKQLKVQKTFKHIRSDFDRIETGLYLSWAIDKVTMIGHPNPALFDLLLSCLQALNNKEKQPIKIKTFFKKELLRCEGININNQCSEKDFEETFFEYLR